MEWKKIGKGTASHQDSGYLLVAGLSKPNAGTPSGPFLFLRSLQCGLALWAIRNSWSCHSVTSPSPHHTGLFAAFNSPPLWKPLPLALALLSCLPEGSSSSPPRPLWNPPSLPIIFVMTQRRAQSHLGTSNHQDREAASLTSGFLDVTCRTVLQVDKLSWEE